MLTCRGCGSMGVGFWKLKPPLHFSALLDQYTKDYNEILS